MLKSDIEYEVVLVDASESPIERPKKRQKHFYSGKKKRHALKSQIVVDKKTQVVICTSFTNGKKHDFRLFKESKTRISSGIKVLTDTGYQGLAIAQSCLEHIHNNLLYNDRIKWIGATIRITHFRAKIFSVN